jgi:hypothetical protein
MNIIVRTIFFSRFILKPIPFKDNIFPLKLPKPNFNKIYLLKLLFFHLLLNNRYFFLYLRYFL